MSLAAGTLAPPARSRPRMRLVRRRSAAAQRPVVQAVHAVAAPAPVSGRDALVRAAYEELADLARLHSERRETRPKSTLVDPALLEHLHHGRLVTTGCSYCEATWPTPALWREASRADRTEPVQRHSGARATTMSFARRFRSC